MHICFCAQPLLSIRFIVIIVIRILTLEGFVSPLMTELLWIHMLWKQTLTDNASDATQDGISDALKSDSFWTPSICCKMFCAHGPPGYQGNAPPFLSRPRLISSHKDRPHCIKSANQKSRWHKEKQWLLELSYVLSLRLITSFLCCFSSHDALGSFLSIFLHFFIFLNTGMLFIINKSMQMQTSLLLITEKYINNLILKGLVKLIKSDSKLI